MITRTISTIPATQTRSYSVYRTPVAVQVPQILKNLLGIQEEQRRTDDDKKAAYPRELDNLKVQLPEQLQKSYLRID